MDLRMGGSCLRDVERIVAFRGAGRQARKGKHRDRETENRRRSPLAGPKRLGGLRPFPGTFSKLEKRRFPVGHRIVQNPGARSGWGHRRPRHPPVSPRPGFRHVGGRSFAPCVLECDFALDTAAGGRQDRKRRRRTRCPATSRQEPQTKPPMFKTPAVRPSPGGQYRIVMP